MKNITPDKLDKEGKWITWRRNPEYYCEEVSPSWKKVLDNVRGQKTKIEESDVESNWWSQRQALCRFLRTYTSESLQRCIECISDENGLEAWRFLEIHCEPSVGTKEADVMRAFTELVTQPRPSKPSRRLNK